MALHMGMQVFMRAACPLALQVLFGPQAKNTLPDDLEPLKLVVRLEGHPSTLRHIRQLKSSSIGACCIQLCANRSCSGALLKHTTCI